ncbi:M56 family metallopeptidase [Rufibacter ruber]|uniref:M56 family metallopeptidase n=1 Tax=Rufibacter ruber TaxID=1783499 RepID=UPI00082B1B6F|nr:M56 family metallopeptidase [Rufibacter ruber]
MNPQHLIHDVLPQEVLHALGWTLLHSLWQGALIALLLAALLGLMHRHTAATRYHVAWAGLVALLLVSGVTFFQLYEPAKGAAAAPATVGATAGAAFSQPVAQAQPMGILEKVWAQGQAYFDQHLPLVVTLWLLGMLILGLKVLGGWVYVQRLRSYRTRAVSEVWQQKTRELGRQLGIGQLVTVAESAMVQVPMVIGHFKPLILFPLGALTGLSTAQVEAILAHELAHVRRKDYLLNLLQTMVETLFFFHPAVWWISDCARTEREHACDDLALALCGDSLTYAYALTHLEEMMMKKNGASPRLAVAFSGRRRTLLSRITRLVQKSTLRPTFSEGFLASCAVIAGVLVFSASAWANEPVQNTQAQGQAREEAPAVPQGTTATAASAMVEQMEEGFTLQQLADGLIIVQNKKGKVVEVYVNGQRVPKDELGKYQDRIEQQLAVARQGKTLRNEAEVEQALQHVEASLGALEENTSMPPAPSAPLPPVPGVAMAPAPPTPPGAHATSLLRAPVPPVPPVPPVAPLPDDEEANRRYQQSMKKYEGRMKEYHAKMEEYHARQQEFAAKLEASQASRSGEHKQRLAEHSERMKDHNKRMAEHAARMKEHEERMKKHNAMVEALKAALVEDGLIKSADDNYEFTMDKTGLTVNGQKQPDATFEKYKKIMQQATGEDVEKMFKKDGASFKINSKHTLDKK